MRLRRWFGLLPPVLLVLSAAVPWAVGAASSNKEDRTTLTIKGMTCSGCVATVKLKLKKTKGVLAYEVNLDKGEADVTYDPSVTSPEAIAAAVSETGFIATVKTKADSDRDRDKSDDASAAGVRGGGD